jgi:hypothetical protein
MTAPETDEFLNTAQAAELIHVSPATLHGWRAQGKGPHVHRFSRRACLYKRSDLIDWINTRRTGDPAP